MNRNKAALRDARSNVDRELGLAASALERAARDIEELKDQGVKYVFPGVDDVLTYVRTLSRTALELQTDVRKANHES